MSKVSIAEYRAAKSATTIGPAEMDIISRAADYGFLEEGEQSNEPASIPSMSESIPSMEQPVDQTNRELNPINDIDQYVSQIRNESEQEIAELRKATEDLKKQLEDERLLREEIQKIKPVETQESDPFDELDKLSIDDFDSEYDFLKEQARIHSELIKKLRQGGVDPRIERAIKYAEEADEEKQRLIDERNRERREEELKNSMVSFWERHPNLKPTRGYDEVSEDLARFKREIADTMQLDSKGVNRMIARLGDPATFDSTKQALEASGVKVMDDFEAVNETIRVFNYMDGYKLNPATGEYVPIRTATGEIQKLADLETAYFVMNRHRMFAEQRREDILKLTEKRKIIDDRPQGISAERLAPISTEDALSPAVIAGILADARSNPLKYKTDPVAKERLEAVYRKLDV